MDSYIINIFTYFFPLFFKNLLIICKQKVLKNITGYDSLWNGVFVSYINSVTLLRIIIKFDDIGY